MRSATPQYLCVLLIIAATVIALFFYAMVFRDFRGAESHTTNRLSTGHRSENVDFRTNFRDCVNAPCLERGQSVPVARPSRHATASFLTRQAASARLYSPEGHAFDAVEQLDPQSLAPATHAMQAWIYTHQHPADCSAAKFMVFHDFASGIGSQIHVMTQHALCAISAGRVMLWGRRIGIRYTDQATCGPGVENWLCHLKAPSSCTVEQAEAAGADTVTVLDLEPCPFWKSAPDTLDPAETLDERIYARAPAAVHALLAEAGAQLSASEFKYWMRAQLAGYFFRLNDAALADIRALRLEPGRLRVTGDPSSSLVFAADAEPPPLAAFPLPRGVVSAHVRHSDKGTEMRLVPFSDYVHAARVLQHFHPFAVQRALFVSTEDPVVAEEAADPRVLGEGWGAVMYDVPRINEGVAVQIFVMEKDGVSPGRLTRLHLMQLLMALECDAWVGTRQSNWNRLVDELRAVWVPKAELPFVEVGDDDGGLGW